MVKPEYSREELLSIIAVQNETIRCMKKEINDLLRVLCSNNNYGSSAVVNVNSNNTY